MTIGDPAIRPAPHWDASFDEALSTGAVRNWVLHVGESFSDTPPTHLFYRFVETIFHAGVTGGCGGDLYCPANPALRRQMAVFLLKARFGSDSCRPGVGIFDKTYLRRTTDRDSTRRIIGRCTAAPLRFCPDAAVLRQQMAVFLLKTLLEQRPRAAVVEVRGRRRRRPDRPRLPPDTGG